MRRWLAAALLLVAACAGDDPEPAAPAAARDLRIGLATVASLDPAEASPDSPSASIMADLLYDGLPSLSSPSSDGLVWTFTLDRGLTFSDGSPITAADAVASLERVRAAGAGSLPAARLDVVASIEADGDSVVVTLTRPMETLPVLLDAPAYGIVPAGGPFDGTVGSGPFRPVDGDASMLEPSPGRSVASPGIAVTSYDDLDDAVADFEAGELDWTLSTSEGEGSPFQATVFYGFNLADPRFADERLRQAIALAVDREAIVEEVYGDAADPLAGIDPGGDVASPYDPDAARDLLAGITVPEVPIDYPEGGDDEEAVAGLLADQLSEVGIPTLLRSHPPAEYAAFAVSGQQGLTGLGWIGVAMSPDDSVDRLFRTASPDNLTGFSDPAVDAALDAGEWAEAEQAILEAAAVVPLARFNVLSLTADGVSGLELSLDGTFDPTTANVR